MDKYENRWRAAVGVSGGGEGVVWSGVVWGVWV